MRNLAQAFEGARLMRCSCGLCVVLLACALRSPLAASQSPSQNLSGKDVYERWCEPCHGDGSDKPGTMALRTKYRESIPAVLKRRTDLSAQVIKELVRQGVSIMAPFRKTEISDQELEALARYLTTGPDASPQR